MKRTSQVKKQYDACISYWSRQYNEVVNEYAGSLFVGHCSARELVHHFYEMTQQHNLDGEHMLHIGIDNPRVNIIIIIIILNLGAYSLHPVHTAFKKGLSELSFDFENFSMTASF